MPTTPTTSKTPTKAPGQRPPPPPPHVTSAPPKSEIFRKFREVFELSRADAGGLFGVTDTTWAGWENNQRPQAAARLLATLLVAKPELINFFLENEVS